MRQYGRGAGLNKIQFKYNTYSPGEANPRRDVKHEWWSSTGAMYHELSSSYFYFAQQSVLQRAAACTFCTSPFERIVFPVMLQFQFLICICFYFRFFTFAGPFFKCRLLFAARSITTCLSTAEKRNARSCRVGQVSLSVTPMCLCCCYFKIIFGAPWNVGSRWTERELCLSGGQCAHAAGS